LSEEPKLLVYENKVTQLLVLKKM